MGNVYSWGKGNDGRLGHANGKDQHTPLMITYLLRNCAPIQLAAGYYHSAVLTAKRQVFTWGWGEYGQVIKHFIFIHKGFSHFTSSPTTLFFGATRAKSISIGLYRSFSFFFSPGLHLCLVAQIF